MKLLCINSLQKLLSAQGRLPLWHMDNRMAMYIFKNKKIAQFQIGYISYLDLNHNKAFKDKIKNYELNV